MYFRTMRLPARAAGLFIAGALLLPLAGCGEEEQAETAAEEAIGVFASMVTRQELAEPVTGTGTIAAHKTTVLGPRVDGIIEEIMVRVGDRVTAGQPLFRTRDAEWKLKVAELENHVRLASAEAQNAQKGFARAEELHGKGFVSNGKLDDARAARDAANARLGMAKAQLATAQQMLEDCVVTAPFNGVITKRDVDEGKFMATRMGGMGGDGGGVLQIMKIDIVAAIVNVPEIYLSKFKVGSKGKVFLDGIDKSYDSYVAILNDRIDPVTRSVEVRLPILNKDYEVKPGLFARAEIYPEAREVLALDRAALLGSEAKRHVFVAENGRAKRIDVTARQIDATRVEVLSGLKEGDKALSGPNAALLIDGMAVRIEGSDEQALASDAAAQPNVK
ncbi:efflux transporter, RND family, MFP subunit [Parvibaculum lavamentivorans DS-1]|uniref:Efflux transporter, RND family, MFP subunit n=1 Tax=Parvibaculum lavamentivorans (strain DS-1 / DSM 13023 / NCIMB 13966) TaxID=402881 RepID=A7HRQ1_PARL1|nr:efflux RND transporter periplasmic adaptor subunit [Parvibaculum lavamentivorans]ABS62584.1 efflux transporter, RND family, MFP subunit [Parvibaculum lavamentivorans DS-1]